jgi:hypothetical protein
MHVRLLMNGGPRAGGTVNDLSQEKAEIAKKRLIFSGFALFALFCG